MSETTHLAGGLTRRGFLKTTGAATVALACAGAVGTSIGGGALAPARANADVEEKVAFTYHQSHCTGNCMLKCTTREGKLCKVEPNDAAAEGFRTVCVKGLSEIEHIYSPERIRTPMKRVGDRGSDEFESISWDEAAVIFADGIKGVQETYGPESVLAMVCGECETMLGIYSVTGAMMGAQGGIDIGVAGGMLPMAGMTLFNGISDWPNASTIIHIGCNYVETALVQSREFFDAQDAGAYMIAIDPHFSTTAAKCDEWIQLRPGSDIALGLGMISLVLENGWYDKDELIARTNFPFLVSRKDGSFLRDHADETGLEDGMVNPYRVIDEGTGSVVDPGASDVMPSLEGEVEIDGVRYATAFTLLKESQRDYPISWASEVTEIDEAVLEDLTLRYATGGPATINFGYGGGEKLPTSDVLGHTFGVLAVLTGNYGKPGAGVGFGYGGGYVTPTLASWPFSEGFPPMVPGPVFELPYTENNVRGIICVGDQLQQHFADYHRVLEWVDTLDFVVCADVFFSSSARYADLILPIASRFESEEEVCAVKAAKGHVMLRERVIDPLFESKTDYALLSWMAEAMGSSVEIPKTYDERVRFELDQSTDPMIEGLTLDMLRENQGVWPVDAAATPYVVGGEGAYLTSSGRLEPYYASAFSYGQALPNWVPPTETAPDSALRSQYPLELLQVRSRFHIHNQFCDAAWIRQFSTPAVDINPVDAVSRGLSSGDVVEVFNDRGSFSCPVRLTEAVRPGVVRVVEGEWTKFMEAGNIQNVTNPTVDDRGRLQMLGPVIPYNDTLVELRLA